MWQWKNGLKVILAIVRLYLKCIERKMWGVFRKFIKCALWKTVWISHFLHQNNFLVAFFSLGSHNVLSACSSLFVRKKFWLYWTKVTSCLFIWKANLERGMNSGPASAGLLPRWLQWASKWRARSLFWVFHMGAGAQATESSFIAFSGSLAGSWNRNGTISKWSNQTWPATRQCWPSILKF